MNTMRIYTRSLLFYLLRVMPGKIIAFIFVHYFSTITQKYVTKVGGKLAQPFES